MIINLLVHTVPFFPLLEEGREKEGCGTSNEEREDVDEWIRLCCWTYPRNILQISILCQWTRRVMMKVIDRSMVNVCERGLKVWTS